jgi:hypothetical protein
MMGFNKMLLPNKARSIKIINVIFFPALKKIKTKVDGPFQPLKLFTVTICCVFGKDRCC